MTIKLRLPTHRPSWQSAGTHLCLDRPEQHRQCSSACRERPHGKNAVRIMKPGENHTQGSLYGLKRKEMLSEKQSECFRKLCLCPCALEEQKQSPGVSFRGCVLDQDNKILEEVLLPMQNVQKIADLKPVVCIYHSYSRDSRES